MEYSYKLSIITVNLNNKEGLQNTIDSVITQTCKDFEWLIIDGGSTDGSKELIEKYDNHINYWVSEPDKGIYNAMNKGILASHGEYLLFLNSGDFLISNLVIGKVIPYLNNKDIYVGKQKSKFGIFYPKDSSLEIVSYIFNMTLPHQASFINRILFDKFGLYNEDLKICSDWEFFLKVAVLNNCSIEIIPLLISEIEPDGISETDLINSRNERNNILNKFYRIKKLNEFYTQNKEIIKALTSNKVIFFLFRIYYIFYRKINKK